MKDLHKKLGYKNAAEFAKALDVSRACISNWYKGTRYPNTRAGKKIMDISIKKGAGISILDIYKTKYEV